MYHNGIYDDVNEALPDLLRRIDKDGEEVGSRVGRTKELTHIGITLVDPVNREIIIPGRKANLAAQIAETAWVLGGRADIEWLGHYLPRAKDFSDDGETWRAGYGARLRHWETREQTEFVDSIDQIDWVVEHLRKDPASRRAVLSLWDPEHDTADGVKDIPCNDWISFVSRLGRLDLHVALRSNDVIWGWSGINQFEWSTLLEVVAGLLGLKVGSLHFSTTSFHLYDHHWAKSALIQRSTYQAGSLEDSPRFVAKALDRPNMAAFDKMLHRWFRIEEKIRNGDVSTTRVEEFPEPMLQSWLRVLQWWWTGERGFLAPLEGTRLERAAAVAMQPPEREFVSVFSEYSPEPIATYRVDSEHPVGSEFIQQTIALHDEKHAAYGDSWKRRGEMLGIMANIARKIDRLGGAETKDETSADTAMDLMVYLAKYRAWLEGSDTDTTKAANGILVDLDQDPGRELNLLWDIRKENLENNLRNRFDALEEKVTLGDHAGRVRIVDVMLEEAYVLARNLFETLDLCNRKCAPGDEHPDCPVHGDQYLGADHE